MVEIDDTRRSARHAGNTGLAAAVGIDTGAAVRATRSGRAEIDSPVVSRHGRVATQCDADRWPAIAAHAAPARAALTARAAGAAARGRYVGVAGSRDIEAAFRANITLTAVSTRPAHTALAAGTAGPSQSGHDPVLIGDTDKDRVGQQQRNGCTALLAAVAAWAAAAAAAAPARKTVEVGTIPGRIAARAATAAAAARRRCPPLQSRRNSVTT